MKTMCRTKAEKTYFIITDVDALYLDAIRGLRFEWVVTIKRAMYF